MDAGQPAARNPIRNTGRAVIMIHHANKGGADGLGREAGSTNQLTNLDLQMRLTPIFEDAERADQFNGLVDKPDNLGETMTQQLTRKAGELSNGSRLLDAYRLTYYKTRDRNENMRTIHFGTGGAHGRHSVLRLSKFVKAACPHPSGTRDFSIRHRPTPGRDGQRPYNKKVDQCLRTHARDVTQSNEHQSAMAWTTFLPRHFWIEGGGFEQQGRLSQPNKSRGMYLVRHRDIVWKLVFDHDADVVVTVLPPNGVVHHKKKRRGKQLSKNQLRKRHPSVPSAGGHIIYNMYLFVSPAAERRWGETEFIYIYWLRCAGCCC